MSTENNGVIAAQETSVPDMEKMSTEEFIRWRNTGELPKVEAKEETTSSAVSPESAEAEEAGDPEDESAEESATSKEDEHEQGEQPKKKGGFQRRIDKLSQKLTAKDQELEYWRQQALRTPTEKKADEPKAATAEPKIDDFTDLDAYVKALTKFNVETARKEYEAAAQAEKQQAEQAKRTSDWQKQLSAGREKYDDFDDVMEVDVPLSQAVSEVLLTSEHGGDLAYWMGKHPEDAKRISQLNPLAAARELGKIEAQFANKEITPEKKPPPATKAPTPPSPVRRVSPATKTFDPNDEEVAQSMSSDEWAKKRNAELRQKGR